MGQEKIGTFPGVFFCILMGVWPDQPDFTHKFEHNGKDIGEKFKNRDK